MVISPPSKRTQSYNYLRIFASLTLVLLFFQNSSHFPFRPHPNSQKLNGFWGGILDNLFDSEDTENVTDDKNQSQTDGNANNGNVSNTFSVPKNFETRVDFWIKIYSQYSSEDAVFHDSQNLSVIYRVVDLRPITTSDAHPFVKEFRVKRLIEKERRLLLTQLRSLKQKLNNKKLNEQEQILFEALGKPTNKKIVADAIENLRMQLGQKSFVAKALENSDLYLPTMEQIFEQKGLPTELTRLPFVESSFNLAARSRVGASGIWQIMPATGRKLIPNSLIDYRNDPIRATEFAATLLKFNYKVTDSWPLAITAYNHGPTSIARLARRYKTKDLPNLIEKAYGSHAFGFASSNFYACFLAILEVEKNRAKYFPEIVRQAPLDFKTIQLKKPIKYSQLVGWFAGNAEKAEQFNPHLASALKRQSMRIPSGTYLHLPSDQSEVALRDGIAVARKI